MDIQKIGKRVIALVEDVFVKIGARDEFAAVEREIFEDRLLARSQRDGLTIARDDAGAWIDDDPPEHDLRLPLAGGAPDQRAHSRQQFIAIEWLHEVIIRARIQPPHPVPRRIARIGGIHRVAFLAKNFRQIAQQTRIIFNEEDSHGKAGGCRRLD